MRHNLHLSSGTGSIIRPVINYHLMEALQLVICQTKRVAWEKRLKLNHKTEKEGRDKTLSSTKSCEPSHENESRKKNLSDAHLPSTTRTRSLAGTFIWRGATTEAVVTTAAIALRTASNFSSSEPWV